MLRKKPRRVDSTEEAIARLTHETLPDFRPSPLVELLLKMLVVIFMIVGFTLVALAFIEPQSEVDTLQRSDFNPVITYTRGA